VAYVRTVKTSSGATAVQIVHSSTRGSRKIEHLGSARSDLEVEALKIAAAKRLAGDQEALDLGIELP
jgi:DNA-binding FadR family transcriptional regulator